MKRKLISAIGVAAMMVSIAACGGDDGGDGGSGGESAAAGDYAGQELTVWVMDGSSPDDWQAEVAAAFEKETKATVKFEVQQWNGIQQKLTTALSEENPPDVFEIGNTQTPAYAKTGGLADLADLKTEIGADWTEALNNSSVFDGKQYAAPWYFANRVVLYNKKVWADAGITTTPKTRDEFYANLETIGEKTDAEPIYLPGQNWYHFVGLVVGEGGELVKQDGDKWVSNLDSPEVAAAAETYKKFQALSKAPKDKDEATPQQGEVFAEGNVGAFIGMGWEAGIAIEANAAIEEQIGYFTIPGPTADKPEGVFLGGSNLAVAAGSQKQDLAKEFMKIILSDEFEGKLAKANGVIPNKESLQSNLAGNAAAEAAAPAAAGGGTTPLIAEWAAVENAPNPIKTYLTAVLNGKTPAQAAAQVEGEFNKRLSQE
ncbi:extracellular solute-binding protein [Streptomyces sp. NPDC048290]|uniref:extracellular solute-binding protein n=1 Tax=Streptomyces sp. NPDC048290 TaxID=3155811 RepID=UPI00343CFA3A